MSFESKNGAATDAFKIGKDGAYTLLAQALSNEKRGAGSMSPAGNMTTDPYKALTIAYNHLNLPKLMTFTTEAGSSTIEVLYDAAGTKLRKTVKTGTTVNYTQDYIGFPNWSGFAYALTL